jgi:hypothetical protein
MSEKKGLYYNVNKRKKAGTSRPKSSPKAPSDADWKNAAKTAKVRESIVDNASSCDADHEVQMARADLYNIAHDALELHKILKNVSEEQGLEGWQQAKITKAADYISSVYRSLNYETMATMATVQTRPASTGSVGVASTMSESEVSDYKALLEKATTRAQKKFMEAVPTEKQFIKSTPVKKNSSTSDLAANEAKWYSGPKPPPRKKPQPTPTGAPQKKNRLRNIAGAAALAAAGLGASATSNDYVQDFGNTTDQATQSQQAADVGGAGLSGPTATTKYTTGAGAAKSSGSWEADLDAQADQIEKDFAAKNAANDANASVQSAAQRDAAQRGDGSASSDLRAALAKQFADYEKSKDASVDDLVKKSKPMSAYANDVANAIIAGATKTNNAMKDMNSAATPAAGQPSTLDPTFMPKNTQWLVNAKAKWLATNPYPEKIREYNKIVDFYNRAIPTGGSSLRLKAIGEFSKWLRDPNNAGGGAAKESTNYRVAENKRNNNDYF